MESIVATSCAPPGSSGSSGAFADTCRHTTHLAYESSQAYDLIERIEILERVAETLPDEGDRRLALLGVVEKDLASAHPFRPRIAAELLDLSEKTVRAV
ncbi:MAG: hypothetical protein ACYCV4_04765 [Dermatophilaceae bacterium]